MKKRVHLILLKEVLVPLLGRYATAHQRVRYGRHRRSVAALPQWVDFPSACTPGAVCGRVTMTVQSNAAHPPPAGMQKSHDWTPTWRRQVHQPRPAVQPMCDWYVESANTNPPFIPRRNKQTTHTNTRGGNTSGCGERSQGHVRRTLLFAALAEHPKRVAATFQVLTNSPAALCASLSLTCEYAGHILPQFLDYLLFVTLGQPFLASETLSRLTCPILHHWAFLAACQNSDRDSPSSHSCLASPIFSCDNFESAACAAWWCIQGETDKRKLNIRKSLKTQQQTKGRSQTFTICSQTLPTNWPHNKCSSIRGLEACVLLSNLCAPTTCGTHWVEFLFHVGARRTCTVPRFFFGSASGLSTILPTSTSAGPSRADRQQFATRKSKEPLLLNTTKIWARKPKENQTLHSLKPKVSLLLETTCQPKTGNRINTSRSTTGNVSNQQMDGRKRVNPKPHTEPIPADGRPETCPPETGNRINTSIWTTGHVPTRNRKPN